MKKINKELLVDFIKFGIVGFFNTFTSIIIINTCFYVFNINEQISNIISFIISVLLSFTLNSIFVFKKKYKNISELLFTLGKTYLSYAFSGLFLTAILIYLEYNVLGIPLYIVSFMNLVVTVPVNFILNRFWAFGKKKNLSKKEYEELSKKHTFAICAYKESPYLEEAIKSIVNQEIKTNIIIGTSTPNKYIENLAKKYDIKYYVRKGKSDIQEDWNFIYNKAKTELVTVAHQDDLYEKEYTKELFNHYDKDILMYNTNYYPYKNSEKTTDTNSKIKHILKFFVKYKFLLILNSLRLHL